MVSESGIQEVEHEEVSWNLSQLLIWEIGQTLKVSTESYIKHDFPKVFDCLKAVKMRISPYLTLDELRELSDMEIKAYDYVTKSQQLSGFRQLNEDNKTNAYKLWKLLDEYNGFILRMLKKYGLLIPMKEDRSKLSF